MTITTKYSCGQMIRTKLGIKGMITAITQRFTNIIYEMTYINDGKFIAESVREEEFELADDLPTVTGFKHN